MYGDIHLKVANAKAPIEDIQLQIDAYGFSEVLHDQELKAQVELNSALSFEESFSKQKSKYCLFSHNG